MLLTISTTHYPATDLGYMLHKHPDKLQSFDLSYGKMHIFYPEATAEKCTAALLLEIDPIGLVRNSKGPSGESFALEHYVNDKPYIASSFMSVAIAKAFSSALNGNCKEKPELTEVVMPFEISIDVLPSRGGEIFLRKLFEPLGYLLEVKQYVLDENFPEWGNSRYFSVKMRNNIKLKDLLSHLYVLIPVLDNDKHYWISQHEVEKLYEKGEGWLNTHPAKDQIVRRYLKNQKAFVREALEKLLVDEPEKEIEETEGKSSEIKERELSLHEQRLTKALEELKLAGAEKVLDLGCGEGKLLRMLMKEKQFKEILGMDISYKSLEIAKERLNMENLAPKQKERIKLIQGALTYRDKRLYGYDAAAVVEVIEHLDIARLSAFERVIFEFARPKTVVVTTPNAEYNVNYEKLAAGAFRHSDHRFEWTRAEFELWATRLAEKNNYEVRFELVGDWDEKVGAPSQMGVFKIKN